MRVKFEVCSCNCSEALQGGPKKRHKVNDTLILQPYVIESCGFQENVD